MVGSPTRLEKANGAKTEGPSFSFSFPGSSFSRLSFFACRLCLFLIDFVGLLVKFGSVALLFGFSCVALLLESNSANW